MIILIIEEGYFQKVTHVLQLFETQALPE
jgi:hypothetical protein